MRFNNVKSLILFPNFLVEDYIQSDLLILNPKRFVFHHMPKMENVLLANEVEDISGALRSRLAAIEEDFDN